MSSCALTHRCKPASRRHGRRAARRPGRAGRVHGPPPRGHRVHGRRARVSGGRVDAADRDGDETGATASTHATAPARRLCRAPTRLPITSPPLASCSKKPASCSRAHPDGDFVSLAGAADHERLQADRSRRPRRTTTLRAVIEREGLRLALDALVLFAHWVTPPIDTRQFDTRFFMTRVPPHQTPAHDEPETTHSLWVRPAARSRRPSARDRPAAADLDHAARARAVRVGEGRPGLGAARARSSAACRSRWSRTAAACCCCPAIRCIPIRPATIRRSKRASC